MTAAHCVTQPTNPTAVLKSEEIMVALGKTQRPWNISEPTARKLNVSIAKLVFINFCVG